VRASPLFQKFRPDDQQENPVRGRAMPLMAEMYRSGKSKQLPASESLYRQTPMGGYTLKLLLNATSCSSFFFAAPLAIT
jgi:hypothetical protein